MPYSPPASSGAVASVNGQKGVVVLTAASVGAASTAALAAEQTTRATNDTTIAGTVTTEATTRATNDTTIAASVTSVPGNPQAASYVLALTDLGEAVEMNVAAANNCTVPPHSTVPFPVGAIIEVFQYGAGQTTIVAGAGVTLRSPSGKVKIGYQFGSVTLRQRAQDEWCLEGDLA